MQEFIYGSITIILSLFWAGFAIAAVLFGWGALDDDVIERRGDKWR